MLILLASLLILNVKSNLELNLTKMTNLTDKLHIDEYTIQAKNNFDYSIKMISFKVNESMYPCLKIIRYFEKSQQVGFNTTFTNNRFFFQLDRPKKP